MPEAALHSPDHPNNHLFVGFAKQEMGAQVHIDNRSRDFGRPSIVWRLTGSDGSRVWLKHHKESRLYRRELIGLERFVPALGSQTWWASPTLVAKDDEIGVLLMTEVEGEPLDLAELNSSEEAVTFRLAGRFACKLHNLQLSNPEKIAASVHVRERLEFYLAEGESAVDSATAGWARELIELACAENCKLVPCHRDFSPRNWLVSKDKSGIKFSVIDWEHASWDLWLNDAQRMAYDHWHSRPQLREAYFEGYGRSLNEAESLQLDTICLATAIASIPWAITHNDENYVNTNRMVIERIRAKFQ
ncbi:MAG: phosphotransferase [Alphaproteobacteria bacterium]|nr:phosphotransferase [Alphaproteobacteria bacterium]